MSGQGGLALSKLMQFSLNLPLGHCSLQVNLSVSMYVCLSHLGNDACQWTRDLWSKGIMLLLGFRNTDFFSELFDDFCV